MDTNARQRKADELMDMARAMCAASGPDYIRAAARLHEALYSAMQQPAGADLVRQGQEATALAPADHKRAMDLVRRAADSMRALHLEMGLLRHQLAEAQGMLLLAERHLQPLAAIHGADAANADRVRAAA